MRTIPESGFRKESLLFCDEGEKGGEDADGGQSVASDMSKSA
jgi:hypothetical protein